MFCLRRAFEEVRRMHRREAIIIFLAWHLKRGLKASFSRLTGVAFLAMDRYGTDLTVDPLDFVIHAVSVVFIAGRMTLVE
jgi:hypothetical protein